jgi:hypothetical protein
MHKPGSPGIGIVKPEDNIDPPAFSSECNHLIITYQIPQTTVIEMETATAVSDLNNILGSGLQDHSRLLTAGYFDR